MGKPRKMLDIGSVWGSWTIVQDVPVAGGDTRYVCKCRCGRFSKVRAFDLRRGLSRRCSYCSRHKYKIDESDRGTPEHVAWNSMKSRCRPSSRDHSKYHDRGISVCDEWKGEGGYEAFLTCVGRRPSLQYSIDRIDNDGDYEPGNVRWATKKEQARNRRDNKRLTIDGVTKCVVEWSEVSGVSSTAINYRLGCGLSHSDAVFKDPDRRAKLTIDGVTKAILEWEKESAVGLATIVSRIKHGWLPFDAVFKPNGRGEHLKRRKLLEIDGNDKTLKEWSEISGIGSRTIYSRLYKGWPPKDAVFTPLSRGKNMISLMRK